MHFICSANQTGYMIPIINLTMKGGDQYFLTNPTEKIFTVEVCVALLISPLRSYFCLCYAESWHCGLQGVYVYCLALLKSTNINIIGRKYILINDYPYYKLVCLDKSFIFMFICHFEILNLCIHSFKRRL